MYQVLSDHADHGSSALIESFRELVFDPLAFLNFTVCKLFEAMTMHLAIFEFTLKTVTTYKYFHSRTSKSLTLS